MHNFSSIYETYNKKKKYWDHFSNFWKDLIEWQVELGIARALQGHLRETNPTTILIVK